MGFEPEDMATAAATGFREGAEMAAKLLEEQSLFALAQQVRERAEKLD